MLPTLTYMHVDCSHDGERVEVRPAVDGNAYTLVVPRCVETHAELVLVSTED